MENEFQQITDDQRNEINIQSGKIMGIGSFLMSVEPDELPNCDSGLYWDLGQIIHDATRKIQNITTEIETAAFKNLHSTPQKHENGAILLPVKSDG